MKKSVPAVGTLARRSMAIVGMKEGGGHGVPPLQLWKILLLHAFDVIG